ncbi:hypothetical protein [Marinicella sp. W31]|uniref:hypothetical protein n=1 Tax=Marinicella sp. W31 TaxID=3023713 RepID=UPI003757CC4D
MKKIHVLLSLILMALAGGAVAVNQGSEFTYQGELMASGAPANGTYDFEFYLFLVDQNGSDVGMVTVDDVTVTNGVFSVEIDYGHPVFTGDAYWLEVAVREGASGGSYTTLAPRQPITATPYALGLVPGAIVDGNAGGPNSASITGINPSSSSGRGLMGMSTTSSGNGTGVRGEAASTNGNATGVFGLLTNAAASGAGIKGQNNGTAGYGVWGQGGSGATGVLGQTNSSTRYGVWAFNSGNGVGLRAESSGNLIEAWDFSPVDKRFQVDNNGNVSADGTYTSPAADFAEMLPAVKGLEPADVLVIGEDGRLTRSTKAYQTAVAGVYSTKPAFLGGMKDNLDIDANVPLAVVGIIPVKVNSENGAIKPGDMLTASNMAGHAMRADSSAPNGSVIGKSLGTLDEEIGVISMLVILQ